jgi:hypothetical protein
MAQTDQLFDLVKSLSKSEKRHFKLSISQGEGDKVFLALFDILEDISLSSGLIRARFTTKFPDSAYEPARKHLYKMLMRSLRTYESDKSVELKLVNLVADVRILFNKGLLKLCFAEIERGKKLAHKNEKFFYYLIFARIELQYLTMIDFPNVEESELLEKQEKINDLLYFELFINKHSSLFQTLSHRYVHQGTVRSETALQKLNDLLLEEFQISTNQRYSSFQADKLHLHFQCTYFLMTGAPEQSLEEYFKLHELFEKDIAKWMDDPIYYIYLLSGILTCLRSMHRYSEMRLFIERLKNLRPGATGLQHLTAHLVFQFEAAIAIDHNNFAEASEQLNFFERDHCLAIQVPANVNATTKIYSAIIFFGKGDLHNALAYANAAMAIDELYLSNHTYALGKLVTLIIHLELHNEDYLIYAIRSFERKLKTTKKLFQTEKITIEFLKKWVNSDEHKRKDLILNYYEQLQNLKNDKYEVQLLTSLNLTRWAEQRMKAVA